VVASWLEARWGASCQLTRLLGSNLGQKLLKSVDISAPTDVSSACLVGVVASCLEAR